jgi:hypothetical protein
MNTFLFCTRRALVRRVCQCAFVGLWLLLGLLNNPATAQPVLTTDEAHADLLYLRRQLRTYHPGMGFYTPEARMEQLFDSLYNHLGGPIGYLDFFRYVSPYVAALKDGHTNLNHRRDFLNRATRYVPFYIRQAEGPYYISHNASSDTTLRRGTELISIDNQPVAHIHKTLMAGDRSGSDGENTTGRAQWSLTQFADYYAAWYGSQDSVQVRYRLPGDTLIRQTRLACPTAETFRQRLTKRYATDFDRRAEWRQPNLSVRLIDSVAHTAVLRVSSFLNPPGFDPFQRQYKRRLRAAFRQVRAAGVRHLIVDLQNNGGGSVLNSARLLQYWLTDPFTVMQAEHMNRAARAEMITRWNPFSALNFSLSYKPDGGNGFANRATRRRFGPVRRLAYRGELYLLMNGASFSAATSVLAKTLDAGRGTFIGEATGGAYWGDFAGQFKLITLPHSQLQVRIPLKKLTHAVALHHANGFTVEPDFGVSARYDDVLQNRNYALRYALQLIGQGITAVRVQAQDRLEAQR